MGLLECSTIYGITQHNLFKDKKGGTSVYVLKFS